MKKKSMKVNAIRVHGQMQKQTNKVISKYSKAIRKGGNLQNLQILFSTLK